MNLKRSISALVLTGLISLGGLHAQEEGNQPTDDLGNVSDAFQEYFFEALKQKGIENYQLALDALSRARNNAGDDPQNQAVLYFEEAKNYKALKRFPEAEAAYLKTLELSPGQLDVMEDLYDLYYIRKEYEKAIPIVEQLVLTEEDYKEDLANLYTRTKAYDKAIAVLDELDESWGESPLRTALRRRVYRESGNMSGAIENLEAKVQNSAKTEQDYLNLVFLYSEEGDTDKAFQTAQRWLVEFPQSELVHLALYKLYFDRGEYQRSVASMSKVFAAKTIDNDQKYVVLTDFLQYAAKRPELEQELDRLVTDLNLTGDGKIYQELGDYYGSRQDKQTALRFYEKGLEQNPDNFRLLVNTVLVNIDLNQHQAAAALAEEGLELFPAQALLYLLSGVAHLGMDQPEAAVEVMESGLDFILDDPRMERDFYEQLSKGYEAMGSAKKANEYKQKANAINLNN